MNELYFKCKIAYMNGTTAKDYAYYRIKQSGEITVASMNRMTISKPKTISVPAGFEISTKEEFELILNKILNC